MIVVGNFNFFLRLTWEFIDLESERGGSICWPNNKIIDIIITSVKVAVWVTWFNIQEHWYGWVPGGACIWWTSLVCNNDSIWFFILLYMREKMAINNGAVFKIWMSDLRTSSKVKKSYSVQLCAARGPPCKLYVMLASVKCLYVAVGLEQYSAKRCYTVQKK